MGRRADLERKNPNSIPPPGAKSRGEAKKKSNPNKMFQRKKNLNEPNKSSPISTRGSDQKKNTGTTGTGRSKKASHGGSASTVPSSTTGTDGTGATSTIDPNTMSDLNRGRGRASPSSTGRRKNSNSKRDSKVFNSNSNGSIGVGSSVSRGTTDGSIGVGSSVSRGTTDDISGVQSTECTIENSNVGRAATEVDPKHQGVTSAQSASKRSKTPPVGKRADRKSKKSAKAKLSPKVSSSNVGATVSSRQSGDDKARAEKRKRKKNKHTAESNNDVSPDHKKTAGKKRKSSTARKGKKSDRGQAKDGAKKIKKKSPTRPNKRANANLGKRTQRSVNPDRTAPQITLGGKGWKELFRRRNRVEIRSGIDWKSLFYERAEALNIVIPGLKGTFTRLPMQRLKLANWICKAANYRQQQLAKDHANWKAACIDLGVISAALENMLTDFEKDRKEFDTGCDARMRDLGMRVPGMKA